jgi:LytR cell envelope-related transcriptional attenuator
VDHAQQLPRAFPWRTATLVAGAFAMLELAALVVVGTLLLARPLHHAAAAPKPATAPAVRHVAHVRPVPKVKPHALRARSHVAVLVLNGNGVQGAASSEAAHLQALGYRIGGAQNAVRHDYARSMVMYAPGWREEARRLSRDTGIRMVAPVDGMKRSALRASPLVLLLGS